MPTNREDELKNGLNFRGFLLTSSQGSSTNRGILSKPWGDLGSVNSWARRESSVPLINLPARVSSSNESGGESGADTPLAELKEFVDLHSSISVREDGKPRRRSIGEGLE
jgi:hypothetical protein